MYIYIHIYIYILTVDFCLLPQEHYTFMWKNVHTHTHAPICDFNSSRCSKFVAGGGFDSHFHATELFIVFLIHSSPPVSGPAAVPGPQWPVAFF